MCSPAAQSAVVELLEESGLPPICVAIADPSNADGVLGEVLVAAVKVSACPQGNVAMSLSMSKLRRFRKDGKCSCCGKP